MKADSKKKFENRMKRIKVPEGFTAKMEKKEGWYKDQDFYTFTLEKPEDIKIEFNSSGDGHTSFKVGDSWRTFDRTGVESSFYHVRLFKSDDRVIEPNTIIAEQLERIAKSRTYYESAVAVPGLPGGFTVAPEGIAQLKARIKTAGHISFTPSGFGTGYLITKKPQRNCQWGETRAKPDLEAFLGHSPLYVSTMDCD